MYTYPPSIQNLIKNFSRLPGIGEKTAERFALYLLRAPRREAEQLAGSILELKEKVRLCAVCFSLSDEALCRICREPSRDTGLLCVVENPADMASIEKSGAFKGRYHVLSGALSPMDGIGPGDIRIKELVERVERGGVQEVLIATGTSVEGEATAAYLSGILESFPVKVTRIASGVPMGGDLKYVDQMTLKRAIDMRRSMSQK